LVVEAFVGIADELDAVGFRVHSRDMKSQTSQFALRRGRGGVSHRFLHREAIKIDPSVVKMLIRRRKLGE
jgi:hypothetical protein